MDQNVNQIPVRNVTKDRLLTLFTEIFNILNSSSIDNSLVPINPVTSTNVNESLNQCTSSMSPSIMEATRSDDPHNNLTIANVASTSGNYSSKTEADYENERKLRIKYKNKYRYIEKLMFHLPPLKDPVKKPEDVQNVMNDVNKTTQNNVNDMEPFTAHDVEQNKELYELLISKLKNSPYNDRAYFNNGVRIKNLNVKLKNGNSVIKPVSFVQPLILLDKCDDMHPLPVQNKNTCV